MRQEDREHAAAREQFAVDALKLGQVGEVELSEKLQRGMPIARPPEPRRQVGEWAAEPRGARGWGQLEPGVVVLVLDVVEVVVLVAAVFLSEVLLGERGAEREGRSQQGVERPKLLVSDEKPVALAERAGRVGHRARVAWDEPREHPPRWSTAVAGPLSVCGSPAQPMRWPGSRVCLYTPNTNDDAPLADTQAEPRCQH